MGKHEFITASKPDEIVSAPAIDHEQSVQTLVSLIDEQVGSEVNAKTGQLVTAVGGFSQAEHVDFWDGISSGQAAAAHRATQALLFANAPKQQAAGDTTEERDVFDTIRAAIVRDSGITSDHVGRSPDVVDFSVGSAIGELAESGELTDQDTIEKAQSTLALLTSYGLYKFTRWGNGRQLAQALDGIEQCVVHVPGFDPEAAGFAAARDNLILSRAALAADSRTKPNWQYAKPERHYLTRTTYEGLGALARTEAHLLLRHNTFDELVSGTGAPQLPTGSGAHP